jgi:hypothetical protein
MPATGTLKSLVIGIIVVIASMPTVRADPPARLRGKSIIVTWSESRIQRHVGEADFRRVDATLNMSAYVSTAGRVFSRFTPTTRAGTASSEQIQGQPKPTPESRARVPTFGERSMTLFQPFRQGGMRRLVIAFDGAYDGCTAKVAYAKEEGASSSFGWSPITKQVVEFQSVTVSGEACRVMAGNVFSGDR